MSEVCDISTTAAVMMVTVMSTLVPGIIPELDHLLEELLLIGLRQTRPRVSHSDPEVPVNAVFSIHCSVNLFASHQARLHVDGDSDASVDCRRVLSVAYNTAQAVAPSGRRGCPYGLG